MPPDPVDTSTANSKGDDAARWNARYSEAHVAGELTPPELVTIVAETLSPGATALDLACGLGDAGLFLAKNGADVTLLDVSRVALDIVERRASAASLAVTTTATDLRHEPPPTGPFDLITCMHFLDRNVLSTIAHHLNPGGQLVASIATTTNLERHSRPSARFLLDPGELPTLASDLHVTHHDEAWRTNGVHEAWLIAERSA